MATTNYSLLADNTDIDKMMSGGGAALAIPTTGIILWAKDKAKRLDKDGIAVTLGMGGLSGPEVKKVMETGVIPKALAKKLNPEVFQDLEDLTGKTLPFPSSKKPEGTPPITGTTVKKQTRTETPNGEVRETTTTFDSNSGIKKSSSTTIPEDDLKDLLGSIDLSTIKPEDIQPWNKVIQNYAKEHNIPAEVVAKELRKNLRTQESLRNSKHERAERSAKVTKAASRTYGHGVDVDEDEIQGNGLTQGQQNLKRHESLRKQAERDVSWQDQLKKQQWDDYLKKMHQAPKFDN